MKTTLTKQQAKNLGENIGIFFVCLGLVMLLEPTLKALATLAKWWIQ